MREIQNNSRTAKWLIYVLAALALCAAIYFLYNGLKFII